MKFYHLNGKTYTEDEVKSIYRMWQDIQDRNSISESIEHALAMISDENVSEYTRNNKTFVMEKCLEALPVWGVWQDECLSQNCLLYNYLIADKLREMYATRKEFNL